MISLDKEIKLLVEFLKECVRDGDIDLDSDDMRSTLYDHAENAKHFLKRLGVKDDIQD